MDIQHLSQVKKIKEILSKDDELSATLDLMIILCNLILNTDNQEILDIMKQELTSEMCNELCE